MEQQVHKPHRKAKEKKQKQNTGGELFDLSSMVIPTTTNTRRTERNPKAFAFSNPGRLARTAARSQDVSDNRIDRFSI